MADDLPKSPRAPADEPDAAALAGLPLARRADFRLGQGVVRPSLRTIEGPAGTATAEPRVMQVLLAFADAQGAVLTREDLIRLCWDGRIVGDDAVNRAIAEVRRAARDSGAGFAIETIPRIGYRLDAGPAPQPLAADVPTPADAAAVPAVSRRHLLGGGIAAAALIGLGGGLWWMVGSREDPRVAALMDDGRRLLREAWPGREAEAIDRFGQVVAIDPGHAEAWGLLAVAWRDAVEGGSPERTSDAVARCEAAAGRALALDPREGSALAALATLRPYFGDWGAAEERMRRVLAVAPDNPTALTHLITLLQSVGRAQESWVLNERALAIEPLSPPHHFRKALKQWIFGRVDQADLTIDRALQLWPRHPAVWNARLYIFAFTGRADAALKLIGDGQTWPAGFNADTGRRWRAALTALATRAPADIAAAKAAILIAAPRGFAVSGTMVLSMLGELDAAYAVADGFLLRRGPLVGSLWPAREQMPVNDHRWRRTMNLFTPATAAMRADTRFAGLCEGIGLTAYWRQGGVGPDAFLRGAG